MQGPCAPRKVRYNNDLSNDQSIRHRTPDALALECATPRSRAGLQDTRKVADQTRVSHEVTIVGKRSAAEYVTQFP
jgi:hypothetical protein